MAPKFLLALTLLLATAMVVRAAGDCTAAECASCVDGSDTECDKCNEGYVAVEGTCTVCQAAKCKTCTDPQTCTECQDKYSLTEEKECKLSEDSASTVAPVAIASTILAASLIAVAA